MCDCSSSCSCNLTALTKGEKGDASSAATLGYKVYKAILTQSSTSAPVATVLQNTLGGTVVWTYNGVGDYTGTLTGVFIDGKTIVNAPNPIPSVGVNTMDIIQAGWTDVN